MFILVNNMNDSTRETCSLLISAICILTIFGLSLMVDKALTKNEVEVPMVIEQIIEVEEAEPKTVCAYNIAMDMYNDLQLFLDTCPVICYTEPTDLENYTCIMYATQSIGRYYITAYNHLETGSKQTASGKTCHEGWITTCAADPRYRKFGEYLEIDGRLYIVEDTGYAVKKRHIDLYFANYKSMARYNTNYQEIYKVSWPFGKPKGV